MNEKLPLYPINVVEEEVLQCLAGVDPNSIFCEEVIERAREVLERSKYHDRAFYDPGRNDPRDSIHFYEHLASQEKP